MLKDLKALPEILIVDDRSENLVALEVVLSKVDAQLIRAGSGNEAIALTFDHDFALVLLDVQMPDMDGFEVAELLRSNEKTAHLPIVFISAIYSGEIYKIKGVDSGAIDFIEKPINPQILLGKVRLFLELYAYRRKLVVDSFLSVVEQVSDGVMVVSEGRIVQVVNPAAEKLLGFEGKSLIGTPFDYPLNPGELQELSFTRKDGLKRQVELNVSSMKWQGEEAFVVSLRDVTERMRAKNFLKLMIEDLNAKNAELESFNYSVSHDLKSPLITISGLAGLLQKTLGSDASEEVRAFVQEICAATEKMGLLLDQLLTISLIGSSEAFLAKVSMNDVVASVRSALSSQIDHYKVDLRVESDLPSIMGESVFLRQMMQNLIENAIKYRSDQTSLIIEVGSVTTSSGKVMFVKDNGIGIAAEYLESIFGLFKRLSAVTEGTGVGLAIVKKVVNFHSGKIWVESSGEGEGSTFWLQLPFE